MPGRGVGVATGPAGLVVVDADRHGCPVPSVDRVLPGRALAPGQVDGVRDGVDGLRLLAALCGQGDPTTGATTLTVRSPSGGLHLWFRGPARTRWRSSVGGDHAGPALGWQVDVRAQGGYIVAPGTWTAAGVYEVVGPVREILLLPAWLAGELARTGHLLPHRVQGAVDRPVPNRARAAAAPRPIAGGAVGWVERTRATALAAVTDCARVPEGAGWSAALNRAAYTLGGLVGAGLIPEHAAHQALLDAAVFARPARTAQALGIIRSGLAAGARRPLNPKDAR